MKLSARAINNIVAILLGSVGYAISYGLAYLDILSHERMLMFMFTFNAIVALELIGIYKTFSIKILIWILALALAQMTVYTVLIGS